MKESDIQSAAMINLFPHVVWATVMTVGKIKGRGGHWITLGFPGLSDIIGQLRDGRLIAIEVKKPGERPTNEQYEFMRDVVLNNGVAFWIDDPRQIGKFLEALGE